MWVDRLMIWPASMLESFRVLEIKKPAWQPAWGVYSTIFILAYGRIGPF